MRRNLAVLMVLLSAAFGLTACPGKPRHKNDNTVIVVMGDPRKIIEGAVTASDFDLDYFDSPVLHIVNLVEFVENEATNLNKAINAEAENAPSKGGDHGASIAFNVRVDKARQSVELFAPKSKVSLTLIKVPGLNPKIEFRSAHANGVGELIHFSVSEDKNFFSLLMFNEDPKDGKTLTAIYFGKTLVAAPTRKVSSPERFNFLYGPNVKVAWPKTVPLKLSICGRAGDFAGEIKAAIRRWQEALGTRLKIEVDQSRRFYPFTDLRQKCIYHVSSYLADPRERYAESGGTFNVVNPSTSEFIDSDIFIWEGELAKYIKAGYSADKVARELTFTINHEYGHALGLHHKFDGTPSIMSYKHRKPELSDYDVRAVRALYE